MSRGNAREGIFDDDRDDARLRDGLAQTVTRYDWELLIDGDSQLSYQYETYVGM